MPLRKLPNIESVINTFGKKEFTTLDFIIKYKTMFPDEWTKIERKYGRSGRGSGNNYSSYVFVAQRLSILKDQRPDKLTFQYIKAPNGWGSPLIANWHNKYGIESEKQYYGDLDEEVKQSRRLTGNERQNRLESAPKLPEIIETTTTIYRRNPDVIAEVLERANGICALCKHSAPFLRASDGTPFLEVHHKVPLGEGGHDTVDNALALCPNCHREEHFGKK